MGGEQIWEYSTTHVGNVKEISRTSSNVAKIYNVPENYEEISVPAEKIILIGENGNILHNNYPLPKKKRSKLTGILIVLGFILLVLFIIYVISFVYRR